MSSEQMMVYVVLYEPHPLTTIIVGVFDSAPLAAEFINRQKFDCFRTETWPVSDSAIAPRVRAR